VPENWCNRRLDPNLHVFIEPAANPVAVDELRIYPPSQCGGSVMECVDQVFTGQGWLSLGLTIGAMTNPAVFFGSVGGCMLGCALHGPIVLAEC
jgi:hypothetical protein